MVTKSRCLLWKCPDIGGSKTTLVLHEGFSIPNPEENVDVEGGFHALKVAQSRVTFYNWQRNLSLKSCSQQTAPEAGARED